MKTKIFEIEKTQKFSKRCSIFCVFKKAMIVLTEFLRKEPENDNVHNLIGYCLVKQGRYEEAMGYFDKAVKLDPNNLAAKKNLKAMKKK